MKGANVHCLHVNYEHSIQNVVDDPYDWVEVKEGGLKADCD